MGNGESRWPVLRLGYGMYYGRTENATLETALTQTGSLNGDLNFFMRPTDNLPTPAALRRFLTCWPGAGQRGEARSGGVCAQLPQSRGAPGRGSRGGDAARPRAR